MGRLNSDSILEQADLKLRRTVNRNARKLAAKRADAARVRRQTARNLMTDLEEEAVEAGMTGNQDAIESILAEHNAVSLIHARYDRATKINDDQVV